MPHSSLAIANEFITRANNAGRTLTHMQLQKLVYLAHGWNLAVNHTPLIEDDFEAWDFGPVIRKLYDALCRYGRSPVSRLIKWGDDTPFLSSITSSVSTYNDDALEQLSAEEADIINAVWEKYGRFPAYKLSALTHEQGSPWEQAFNDGRNKVVGNASIRQYFETLSEQQ